MGKNRKKVKEIPAREEKAGRNKEKVKEIPE